jgi:HEAT repeat protein
MKTIKIFIIIVLVGVDMIGCASPVTEEPKNQETKKPQSEIEQLIQQLGADDWETREKAQEALEEWPADKIGEIESAIKEATENKEPEIRMRAKQIITLVKLKTDYKFTENLLKEFPDIYDRLREDDTSGKFNLLESIARKVKCDSKPGNKITRQDIANIIRNILREKERSLTDEEKHILLSVIKGSPFTKEIGLGGRSLFIWHEPIPEAAPCLKKLLEDSNAEIRREALDALTSCVSADEAKSEVIRFLDDSDSGVKKVAIDLVVQLNAKEAIPEIRKLLKDTEGYTAYYAAQSLWHLQSKEESLKMFKELLKSDNWMLREYALQSLARDDRKETIPDIKPLLKDENEEIRVWAVVALVDLGVKDPILKETISKLTIRPHHAAGSESEDGWIRDALKKLDDETDKPAEQDNK